VTIGPALILMAWVFSAMTGASTTGGTAHSTTVGGLANGGSYNFYVRCQDAVGNANPDDYPIAFSVASPPLDTTPPGRLNGLPSGVLPTGTTQATLSLVTNEAATCRYATTPGVLYSAMTETFTTTGGDGAGGDPWSFVHADGLGLQPVASGL